MCDNRWHTFLVSVPFDGKSILCFGSQCTCHLHPKVSNGDVIIFLLPFLALGNRFRVCYPCDGCSGAPLLIRGVPLLTKVQLHSSHLEVSDIDQECIELDERQLKHCPSFLNICVLDNLRPRSFRCRLSSLKQSHRRGNGFCNPRVSIDGNWIQGPRWR